MDNERTDPFYVGYLALPRAHKRFLFLAVPLCVVVMLGSALILSANSTDWGDGYWQTGEAQAFEGRVRLEPYPMLEITDNVGVTSFLLVEMGKFGPADRFGMLQDGPNAWDGQVADIRGRIIRRDGRQMIELDDSTGASAVLPHDGPPTPDRLAGLELEAQPVQLVGEIMDSKCYLGAMKPGEGRGHKACATLCISGGIPPMLVTRNASGTPSYLLLTDEVGQGLRGADLDRIKPLIAEPVRVTGRPGHVGSWSVLAIDPMHGVRPVGP